MRSMACCSVNNHKALHIILQTLPQFAYRDMISIKRMSQSKRISKDGRARKSPVTTQASQYTSHISLNTIYILNVRMIVLPKNKRQHPQIHHFKTTASHPGQDFSQRTSTIPQAIHTAQLITTKSKTMLTARGGSFLNRGTRLCRASSFFVIFSVLLGAFVVVWELLFCGSGVYSIVEVIVLGM